MSLTLRNVQLDVPADRYDAAVAFWDAALGATAQRTHGAFTHLAGIRSLVGVHLQRTAPGDEVGVHLDLAAGSVGQEVARLLDLGAVEAGAGPCPTLRAPGGTVLCVCEGAPDEHLRPEPDPLGRLQVLVVDVASEDARAAAAFWSAALGTGAEHLPAPYDAYHRLEAVAVPGGTMRMLLQDTGPQAPARVHLDLHVPERPDRDALVARLVALGASVLDEGRFPWTVLRDPVGNVLCAVPDA